MNSRHLRKTIINMLPKRWIETNYHKGGQGVLSPVETMLLERGYVNPEDRHAFLNPQISHLHDPFLLPDMQVAVLRIKTAIKNNEKIAVYGDYDVDGMTSTAIVYKTLVALKAQVTTYIPERFSEGYGVNREAIEGLASEGVKVIITVDCGITAIEAAAFAKSVDVAFIVTDHHECQAVLPDAFAIINPKRLDSVYPYDMLAGAGIAFKLSQALMDQEDRSLFSDCLQLAAIGTIADIAPLTGENRIIAKFGLEAIQGTQMKGLLALIEVAGLSHKTITAGHIGFGIGPRLNAVGRLEHAKEGVALLLTEDEQYANGLAHRLNHLNQERQALEKSIFEKALTMMDQSDIHTASGILVVWGESWHVGVVGIVASRLTERFYRPSIVLSLKEGVLKGSARSIDGFSIFEALLSQEDKLLKFGGHEQAAGLTLPLEALPAFLEGLKVYCQNKLTKDLLVPKLEITTRLTSKDIGHHLMLELEQLAPYGMGNPKPIFRYDQLMVDHARMIGKEANHLKLVLNDENRLLEALQFNTPIRSLPKRGERIDLACQLETNTFNGVESIQMHLKDMRRYDEQANWFNKRLLIIYLEAWIKWLTSDEPMIQNENLQGILQRTGYEVREAITAKRTLVVTNYTVFLEIAYHLHDSGQDILKWLDEGYLKICPCQGHIDDILLDFAPYTLPEWTLKQALCGPKDWSADVHLLEALTFDRDRFKALYQSLKQDGELHMREHLMASETPLVDRLAFAFFEEAGFTIRSGQLIRMHLHHRAVKFEETHLAKRLAAYKMRVVKLIKVIETSE